MICPPVGDHAFDKDEYWLLNKTLYGLQRFPCHWYNMIKVILLKMGLNPSPYDPFLLSGILMQPSSHTDSTYSISQLHTGLYVNYFFLYLSNPVQKELSKLFSRVKLRLNSWATLTTSWDQFSTVLITSTETYQFTYVNQNSHYSQHIASLYTPSTRWQTWLWLSHWPDSYCWSSWAQYSPPK